MSGTIYVRERRKVEKGEKKPRFRVVATTGDIRLKVEHIRKLELDALASGAGVQVVYLPSGGDGSGKGKEK